MHPGGDAASASVTLPPRRRVTEPVFEKVVKKTAEQERITFHDALAVELLGEVHAERRGVALPARIGLLEHIADVDRASPRSRARRSHSRDSVSNDSEIFTSRCVFFRARRTVAVSSSEVRGWSRVISRSLCSADSGLRSS